MLRATSSLLRTAAPRSATPAALRLAPSPSARPSPRFYSTPKDAPTPEKEGEGEATSAPSEAEAKLADLSKQLEDKNKLVAELKDARLRSLADFENLQKISLREKQQAKDFALTSFAKDLISSIDIISLALKSIPAERLTPSADKDLLDLHMGVTLTKKEIEKVLKRHGVVPFNPEGEQFDPNLHEALYQAPVPGKEPGSVLECQEIGYMIKDRLLRPAKVGVVLSQE
ncbi:GrpE-domain-containing protein [Leucosporidium creatinivorum]|uniref:GrpE protein homolog n=1 Tax=Leucosporidium creatinivorum TaxID=106004 RepID=A0A1Y2EWM7_9BASI|nr:GrpE-domain-containing protein [Leucosporidium creatinivorum]